MATENAQQWLQRQYSHLHNLANELHGDQQLYLMPPPSELSDEVRTMLRQGKPCRSLNYPDLLCDFSYFTGLDLPNDVRGLLVVDVLSAILVGQAAMMEGLTANNVVEMGLVMRPRDLVHEVQQLRVQMQHTQQTMGQIQVMLNAIASIRGVKISPNTQPSISIAPIAPLDIAPFAVDVPVDNAPISFFDEAANPSVDNGPNTLEHGPVVLALPADTTRVRTRSGRGGVPN